MLLNGCVGGPILGKKALFDYEKIKVISYTTSSSSLFLTGSPRTSKKAE
jgi:hypothetical protein